MSDRAKPWLETWSVHGDMLSMSVRSSTEANVRLAAAAPALARALCRVEWGSYRDITDYESQEEVCPACDCPPVTITNRYGVVTPGGHAPDCPLDAALTAAGLATEDREEVRRGS